MTASRYETSNTFLASFLLSQGVRLGSFEHVSARRVLYRFVADDKLHECLRLYWSGIPTPITPGYLFATLHRLKCLVRRKPTRKAVSVTPFGLSPDPFSAAGHAQP